MAKERISVRQGDVFLKPCKAPKDVKKLTVQEDNCVAYGEVTGHHHKIADGTVYVGEGGKLFVKADENCRLEHRDRAGSVPKDVADATEKDLHLPQPVDEGWFEVKIEEEYQPEGMNRVID